MTSITRAHYRAGAMASDAEERADRRMGMRQRVRDAVVFVFGTLGLVAVGWMLLAWAAQLSVIVLITGSMSPVMPAGSAAVVQTVAAADLAVGDVVTVPQQSSDRPVTHRVVKIEAVPMDDAARSLTLKGDANSIVDLEPYQVTEVERVLVSSPFLGWLVVWAKSPLVMIAVSVLVAVVMAWGLWPTRDEHPTSSEDGPKGSSDEL